MSPVEPLLFEFAAAVKEDVEAVNANPAKLALLMLAVAMRKAEEVAEGFVELLMMAFPVENRTDTEGTDEDEKTWKGGDA